MHPLYFIEISGMKIRGKWFLECDRDETLADVLETVRLYGSQVLKVLEVCEDQGMCRDVTREMVAEVAELEANAAEAAYERHCEDFHDGGCTRFNSLEQQQEAARRLK